MAIIDPKYREKYLEKSQYAESTAYTSGALAAQQGMLAGTANAIQQTQPTVAGALGRIDSLNERLAQIVGSLAAIAEAIGSPYPVGENSPIAQMNPGIVHRLHERTDSATVKVSEIEELIGAISRALG